TTAPAGGTIERGGHPPTRVRKCLRSLDQRRTGEEIREGGAAEAPANPIHTTPPERAELASARAVARAEDWAREGFRYVDGRGFKGARMSGRGFTFARRHALAAGHAKPTAVMIGRWLSAEALRGPGELGMVELDVGLVLNALHGNVELAFGGLERVREIVIDLDIAEDPAFPAFLREYRAPLYAAWCAANPAANYGDRAYDSLRRRWERDAWTAFYGGRIQATIALLRRRMRAAGIPDGALEVVTSASRGVHLPPQLDEPVDVHAAAHVARRLALSLAVPEGVSVEAFPVATSGLGRMCGATLTGRQRACSDGLRGARPGRRAADPAVRAPRPRLGAASRTRVRHARHRDRRDDRHRGRLLMGNDPEDRSRVPLRGPRLRRITLGTAAPHRARGQHGLELPD